jgi:DnaJ-class molecular chaperone
MTVIPCPKCKGFGRVSNGHLGALARDKTCPECQGGGVVRGTARQVKEAYGE